MSRTKNAINNSLWGLFSKLITLIMPFIVKAVIIRKLGIDYLGLNGLFTSILNVLNLTELGIGSAIIYSMYKPIAESNNYEISALLNLYKKIYRVIGLIILIIGIIIIPFLPQLVKGNIPSDINLYILFCIYLVNVLITYFLYGYRTSLLYAYQRSDIISKVTLLFNFMMYSLQIYVIYIFQNYYFYILFLPLSSILINLTCAYTSKRIFPEIQCSGEISIDTKNDIKKKVIGLSLNKIAYASRNAFDSIIISAFIGLSTVGIFNNYFYIINSISAILKIIMTSITASIGNSIVLENTQKNEKDMKVINFLYISISAMCFCILINLFQPFMYIWAGSDLMFSNQLMILISIYFLVDKLEHVVGIYYDATGMWWKGKYKGLLEALVNLSLNIILCRFLGVGGVVLATIISIIIVAIPFSCYYVYKFYYHKALIKFLLNQILYFCFFLIIGLTTYFICNNISFGNTLNSNIKYLIIRLLMAGTLFIILYFICFSKMKIFKDMMRWVKNHLKLMIRR